MDYLLFYLLSIYFYLKLLPDVAVTIFRPQLLDLKVRFSADSNIIHPTQEKKTSNTSIGSLMSRDGTQIAVLPCVCV